MDTHPALIRSDPARLPASGATGGLSRVRHPLSASDRRRLNHLGDNQAANAAVCAVVDRVSPHGDWVPVQRIVDQLEWDLGLDQIIGSLWRLERDLMVVLRTIQVDGSNLPVVKSLRPHTAVAAASTPDELGRPTAGALNA